MLAVLPPEIWDEIINRLEYDYEPLAACARVCIQWNPRAKSLLDKWVDLFDMEEVRRVAKIARANGSKGPRWVALWGGRNEAERGPIAHLAAFAAMFAGRWTRVRELTIYRANWAMGEIRMDTFLDISTFTSITKLCLYDITFPTAVTFAHLVCSLENLIYLDCHALRFSAPHTNPLVFPTCIRTINLRTVEIGDCPLVDIVNFFLTAKIADHIERAVLRGLHQPSDIDESAAYGINYLLKSLQLLHDLSFHVDLSHEPTNPMESLVGRHIFLGQSSNLETLQISYSIGAEYSDYHWLADTLSRITCDSIRTIQLWAHWRGGSGRDSDEARYHGFISGLDAESCAHLERAFALPVFAKLEAVAFIPCLGEHSALQIAWADTVQSRFPQLYSRGILRFTYLT